MSNAIWSIVRAEVIPGHEWFFLGTQSGISIFDASESSMIVDDVLGATSYFVHSMLYDPPMQRLYVGTDDGLYAYSISSDGASKIDGFPLTEDGGLASANILSIALDGNQLYFGTSKGLHKYDLTKMNRDGLYIIDSSGGLPVDAVSAIAIWKRSSQDGMLYAGTIGGGVAILEISYGLSWIEWGMFVGGIAGTIAGIVSLVLKGGKLVSKIREHLP